MSHIVLLGDSIFDNGAYVHGGPAVIDQVRERLPEGWRATLNASDGSVIDDVHRQLAQLPEGASHLVVSVGGNDILAEIAVLGESVGTVGEGLRRLAEIRDGFERAYRRLAHALRGRGLPAVVATIYNPHFPDGGLQREAVAALCLFNDVVFGAARECRLPVLDLRAVCTAAEDYANPIEPSSLGGAKIALAIRDILMGHDFSRREAALLP